jgi:ATP-dependent Clp protease protease subunit
MTTKTQTRFWNFKNATDENAELLIYGVIGDSFWSDGVDAKEFAQTLTGVKAKKLTVRINSEGGDVFAGQAIYSMLKRFNGEVITYVDGLAASIASIIAMAGKLIMPNNAMLMIHNPWTFAGGDAESLRQTADTLDKVRESLIAVYREKSGLPDEEIIALMDAETWMTAADAVEKGFADEIDGGVSIAASIRDSVLMCGDREFDLSRFRSRPKVQNVIQKEAKTVEMTLEKLKAEFPDLFNQVRNAAAEEGKQEGIKAERERIKSIEDLALAGHDAIVNAAKFEKGISAEAVAMEIIKAEKQKRSEYLNHRAEDASALEGVQPAAAPTSNEEQAKIEEEKQMQAFARGANKKR